jgi:fermentation-respiration switch protein FrsA (DUF1100 family)
MLHIVKRRLFQIPSFRRLLAVIVGTYAAGVMFTGVFQTKLIYFPSQTIEATPASVGLAFDDLMLTADDGVNISAWFVPNSDARATILLFHGNAGNNGDRVQELRVLHSLRCNVMIVDYRGFGESEGHPTENGTYMDARAAWDHLTQFRGIPDRSIIIMGESLGGAVAIDLALRHPPAALVVQSTFTRLADIAARHYRFLPVRWLLRHRYDSIDKVGRVSCPKLFIHSTGDTLIPIANGKALFDAASEPKQFLQTPGEHNEGGFMYSHEYTAKLKEFLDSIFPNYLNP